MTTAAWSDEELDQLERQGQRREAVALYDIQQRHLSEFETRGGRR